VAVTDGAYNSFVGVSTGLLALQGQKNICIGYGANVSSSTSSLRIAIGSGAVATKDSTWIMGAIGTKQCIKEGANAAMGVAVLSSGTVVVSNTLVTANSRIFLTAQNLGTITVPVGLVVSARSAGSSFTILSGNLADTSTIAWEIKEPA